MYEGESISISVSLHLLLICPTSAASSLIHSLLSSFPAQRSSEANITFVVVEDLMPELSERYTLTLTAVRTISTDVSPNGYALLSDTNTMATITIAASNSPHGVIEFQQGATLLNISETTTTRLTIIRAFGNIGEFTCTHTKSTVNCTYVCVQYVPYAYVCICITLPWKPDDIWSVINVYSISHLNLTGYNIISYDMYILLGH